MRRLKITKGHRLRRADREQLRPAPGEIEATKPQQRRQCAGEVGGCPRTPGSTDEAAREPERPEAAQDTRQHRRGHQGHARGRSAPPGDHQGPPAAPAPGEIEAWKDWQLAQLKVALKFVQL